jgi:hypothetical protein
MRQAGRRFARLALIAMSMESVAVCSGPSPGAEGERPPAGDLAPAEAATGSETLRSAIIYIPGESDGDCMSRQLTTPMGDVCQQWHAP